MSNIEHHLYDIELRQGGEITDRKIILMTPSRVLWYALRGYQIFDYSQKLELEPVLYNTEQEEVLWTQTQKP